MKVDQKKNKTAIAMSSHSNLSIFNKVINNNSKLIPFNFKFNFTGKPKYFPPYSKE
jgi:hypothetical protein